MMQRALHSNRAKRARLGYKLSYYTSLPKTLVPSGLGGNFRGVYKESVGVNISSR